MGQNITTQRTMDYPDLQDVRVLRTKAKWSHTNGDVVHWEEVQFDEVDMIFQRVWWGYSADTSMVRYGFVMEDEAAARKLYHDVGGRGWRGNPQFDPTA